MPNKKISQLDVRTSPTLADLLAIADPSTGYAYKITGTNLQTVLEIPNKVPYTGATANVNLGAYSITATNIIRAGGLATQFLKADGSVDSTTYMNRAVYDTDGNGVVDAAEKMQTIGRNSTGVTLYKGTIVYISGSTGNRPNFVKAQANSEATSAGTFGVVVSDIANNSDGYVATIGTLADLDTRTTATNPFTSVTLADGDTLYLDPNTAGYVTNVKPSAPNHIVYVGKVVRTSPTLGTIVYRIQNGYELNEIHDVSISSVANNDVLVYESSSTLWKNKSISTILGYTPANDSLVVHLAGAETITGVKTFQNALKTTVGNNLLNTGGGNTVIGYTADPATSATYELDVNGAININTGILNKKLYTDTSAGIQSFKIGTGYELYGTLHSAGGYSTYITTNGFASGWNIVIGTNTAQSLIVNATNVKSTYDLQALAGMSNVTGNGSMSTYFSSPYEGFKPNTTNGWGFAIFNSANSPMMAVKNTGQMQLNGYTSTSVFTGTVAGLLGFDSSGNVITTSASGGGITGSGTAGQVTYWNGTSAVTGSSNLFWDNTNGRLGIGTSSPATSLVINKTLDGAHGIQILNTSTGTAARTSMLFGSAATGGTYGVLLYLNSTYTSSGLLIPSSTLLQGGSTGGLTLLAADAAGIIRFAAGGATSPMVTLNTTGAFVFNSPSPSNNTYFESYNSSGTLVSQMKEASTGGSGGILFNGQRIEATGGNAIFFNGFAGNTTNNSAIEFRGNGGTIASPADLPSSIPIAIFSKRSGGVASNQMVLFSSGNLMLQNGGTFTDGGQRLQVIGSMRVGTTAASAMYWDDTNNRLIIGNTSGTARLDVGASTTSAASLRIRSGTAPTTPNEGDIWQDGTNIKIYIGGSTKTFTII